MQPLLQLPKDTKSQQTPTNPQEADLTTGYVFSDLRFSTVLSTPQVATTVADNSLPLEAIIFSKVIHIFLIYRYFITWAVSSIKNQIP